MNQRQDEPLRGLAGSFNSSALQELGDFLVAMYTMQIEEFSDMLQAAAQFSEDQKREAGILHSKCEARLKEIDEAKHALKHTISSQLRAGGGTGEFGTESEKQAMLASGSSTPLRMPLP